MTLVLVIEDDSFAQHMLSDLLGSLGYDVRVSDTGREGLEIAAKDLPDIVVLDLGLPDISGHEVIRRLRAWSDMPVLVVSGSRQVRRKADALDAGADDFLDKPFDVSELRARLRVAERRLEATREHVTSRRFDDIDIDYTLRRVHRAGVEIRLTETEWMILDGLSREPGRVVTHRWLTTHVWGPHAGAETHQTIRAHVKTLRAKIHDDARDPRFVRTETGIGYRWVATPLVGSRAGRPVTARMEQLVALREAVSARVADPSKPLMDADAWRRLAELVDEALRTLDPAADLNPPSVPRWGEE